MIRILTLLVPILCLLHGLAVGQCTPPTVNFSSSPGSVCVGQNVTLNYTGSSAQYFEWDCDGCTQAPLIGQGPHNVSWASGGQRTVSLRAGQLVTIPGATFSNTTDAVIPDNGCGVSSPATVPISVSNRPPSFTPAEAAQIRVTLNIAHPNTGELYLFLVAPDLSVLALSYTNGSAANFTNTTFTDGIFPPITAGTAPFTSTFLPQGATTRFCNLTPTVTDFAGFANKNPNGTWYLVVYDAVTGNEGTVLDWSINFPDGTGPGCLSDPITRTVNINAETPIVNANTPVCLGSTLNFTASSVAGATYAWQGPNGFSSTQQNPSISAVSAAGSGTYTLTTNVAGCNSVPTTVQVIVIPPPTANFNLSQNTACVGEGINATYSGTAPVNAFYDWQFDGGQINSGSGQGPYNVAWNTPGAKTVRLTVTQNFGSSGITFSNTTPFAIPDNGCVGGNGPASPININGLFTELLPSDAEKITVTLNISHGFTEALKIYLISPDAKVLELSSNNINTSNSDYTATVFTDLSPVNITSIPNTFAGLSFKPQGRILSSCGITTNVSTFKQFGGTNPNGIWELVVFDSDGFGDAGIIESWSISFPSLNAPACASQTITQTVTVTAGPATPQATNDSPTCIGGNVNLSTPTVSGVTYSWVGPNGFSSALQNPTLTNVSALQAGNYTVTITAPGCAPVSSNPTTVVVNATINPATISNNGPLCQGSQLILSAQTIAGATYSWTGPNGFVSALQNPTRNNIQPADAGIYTLIVTVGTCTAQSTTTLSVQAGGAPATPFAGNNGPICQGQNLQLSASFIPGASYLWTGPGITALNEAEPNPTITNVQTAGTLVYQVSVNTGTCNSALATTNAVVRPTPTVSYVTGNQTICVGSAPNVQLQLTGTGPWTVNYLNNATFQTAIFGNVVSPSPSTFTLPLSLSTSGTITLINVTDGSSCFNNQAAGQALSITVKDLPDAQIIGLPVVCAGETAALQVSVTNVPNFDDWTLTYSEGGTIKTISGFGNKTFNIITDPLLTTTTVQLLTIRNDDALPTVCSRSLSGAGTSTFVTVRPAPTAVLASQNQSYCTGGNGNFNVQLSGKGPWQLQYTENNVPKTITLGNGAFPSPSLFSIPITPVVNTTYTLTGVIDGNNCSSLASGSFSIRVNEKPSAEIITTMETVCGGTAGKLRVAVTGVGPWTLVYYKDGVAQTPVSFGSSTSAAPFIHTITVTATATSVYSLGTLYDGSGCSNATNPGFFVLEVIPAPTLSLLSGNQQICNGNSATFTVRCTGTGPWIVQYNENGTPKEFTVGNSASPSPSNFSISVFPTVSTVYTLTGIKDAMGCSAMGAGSFTVVVSPRPTVSFVGSENGICSGESLQIPLLLTGTGPWTVQYAANNLAQTSITVGNTNSPNPATEFITLNPSVQTIYTLSSVSDANGCTNTANGVYSVSVRNAPTATLNGTTAASCNTNLANVSVVVTGVGPWTLYYTLGGVAQTATVGSPATLSPATLSFQVNASSVANLILTAVGRANGCTALASGTIQVVPGGAPNFTVLTTGITCANPTGTISVNATGGTGNYTYAISGGPFSTSNVFSGLNPGSYLITVKDDAGCEKTDGPFSIGALAIPTIITTTNIGATTATINWTSIEGATYTLRYRPAGSTGSFITVNNISGTSHTLNLLTSNTEYEVQVQANCPDGTSSEFSSLSNFTTTVLIGPCNAPTNLTLTPTGTNQLSISWTAAAGAACYDLQYRIGNGNWQTVQVTDAQNPYLLTMLQPTQSYSVRMRTYCNSCNGSNRSTFSGIVTYSPPSCPTAVSVSVGTQNSCGTVPLTANVTGGSGVALQWLLNGNTLAGATGSSYNATQSGSYSVIAATNGCTPLTSIQVNVSVIGLNFDLVVTANQTSCTTCADATIQATAITSANYIPEFQYMITGPVNRPFQTANYFYNVPAGTYTVTAKEMVSGCTVSKTIIVLPPQAPPVPSIISITNILYNRATVNWTAVTGAAAYNLSYRVQGAPTWVQLNNLTGITRILTSLQNATTYEVRIQSKASNGAVSAWSNITTFTTPFQSASCLAPGGLFVTTLSATTAKVQWNIVAGAACYAVEYRRGSLWTVVSTTQNAIDLSGLVANSNYQVRIRANCVSCGSTSFSNYSPEVDFTTPASRLTQDAKTTTDKENHFAIYPNPARERFTLEALLSENENAVLNVFDAKGAQIAVINVKSGTQTIETQKWGTGIYYCKIISNAGNNYTAKVVVLD